MENLDKKIEEQKQKENLINNRIEKTFSLLHDLLEEYSPEDRKLTNRLINKSLSRFHLNENYDLSFDDIRDALQDFDTFKEFKDNLYKTYKKDYAYSWEENAKEVFINISKILENELGVDFEKDDNLFDYIKSIGTREAINTLYSTYDGENQEDEDEL